MSAFWERPSMDSSLVEEVLRDYRCTVGDLVDLANALSDEELAETAEMLSECIRDRSPLRRFRREIVLLGAVMHRLIFDVHKIPKSRDAPL